MATSETKTTKPNNNATNPEHDAWLAAIIASDAERASHFAPGEWGAHAAKAWGCSDDEALRRAIELLEAGRLELVTESENYQRSFELRAQTTPLRSNRRAIMRGITEELAALATADSAQPYALAHCHPHAEVVLIAFGKLVLRNFELYPASPVEVAHT